MRAITSERRRRQPGPVGVALRRCLLGLAVGLIASPLCFAPTSPAAATAQDAASTASPPPPANALLGEIPFEDREANRIYLDLAPEGQRPFVMLLDTGASGSVLTPGAARDLGVTIRRRKSSPYRRKTRLGRDLQFWIDDSSSDTSSRTGWEYGLLGGTFLREYVVELDFANRMVRFYDPKKFKLPKKVSAPNEALVPISIQGNRPFVKVEINGKKVPVLMDTGAPTALTISGKAARKFGIDVKALPPFGSAYGVVGKTDQSFYQADSLRLGPFDFAPTPVDVLPQGFYNQGGNTDSLLGYDLLQQFTVRIDYKRSRMWLRRENTKITYLSSDYIPIGETGVFASPDEGVYYVRLVMPNSPVGRLGLRAGDLIEKSGGESLDAILQRLIDGEELIVTRQNEAGIRYDVVLPNDEWLGDAAAEGE